MTTAVDLQGSPHSPCNKDGTRSVFFNLFLFSLSATRLLHTHFTVHYVTLLHAARCTVKTWRSGNEWWKESCRESTRFWMGALLLHCSIVPLSHCPMKRPLRLLFGPSKLPFSGARNITVPSQSPGNESIMVSWYTWSAVIRMNSSLQVSLKGSKW